MIDRTDDTSTAMTSAHSAPPSRKVRHPTASIRDELETDAWGRYPSFSARMVRQRRLAPHRAPALRWHDRVLLVLAIVLLALLLLRGGTAEAAQSWGVVFSADGESWPALALATTIEVEVTGRLARGTVHQSFINRTDRWVEGVYRYPLPPGAAVDRMRMEVGDRIVEGEIQERDMARRVYQQARETGQVAALVEQQRPNQHESRLANIGPGETLRISVGFLFPVEWRDGSFHLVLPMTFTPRWGDGAGRTDRATAPSFTGPAAGVHSPLDLQVLLRTGLGFASVESRYHDVDIFLDPEGYRVSLLPGRDLPDRDFALSWTPAPGAAPQADLLTWDGGDAIYAQLMVTPPLAADLAPRMREVVFVIDTSGSMEGASLDQAREALLRGLDHLDARDAFNLIQFNSYTEALFPASGPADDRNLQAARDYLAGLRADGGTVMAPALHRALSLPPRDGLLRQVVFITDGSVGNEAQLLAQIGDQLGQARLFTVSIGAAPNAWFMRKAAAIGRGSHTRIGRLDEVETRMNELWSLIRHPALADICVDFGVDAEYYPEVIPDLYAGQPLWLTARMARAPADVLLCGRFDGADWEHRVVPRLSPGASDIATLWARSKIESLEDSILFGADPAEIRAAVTGLALQHGLLTRYTSLVAVDRSPARPKDEGLAQSQVPSLLPAGSASGTAGFPQTATGWAAQALLSALTLLIATALFLFTGSGLPARVSRTSTATSPE